MNKYTELCIIKQELEKKNLSPEEYEKAIIKKAKELKI